MAIKYARLWDPVNQFQIKSGQLNVAGRVFVRLEATDDLAQLYDENHTLMPQPIVLDNNGRSRGVFVDAAKTYWIDVQDRYGMSLFTVRKMTPCGGGGGSSASSFEVVSSDGTINVQRYVDGGVVTFDVSVADDSAESLDWIRCDGSDKLAGLDIYKPIYTAGTMVLSEQGIILGTHRYYHVTAHVKATKGSVSPFYENAHVTIKTRAGSTVRDVITTDNLVDYSLGLSQEFEVSADVYSPEECEMLFEITSEGNATFALSDVAVHRVYIGMSQSGESVRYTGENGVIVNNFTDKISADLDVVQHKLTPGSNITISDNVISAQQPDVSQFVTGSEVTTQIENAIANVREVPASDPSDVNKVLTVAANGDYDWSPVPSGVTDVKVDGTSVVTAGVANITMPTVPTKVSQLQNDSQYITLSDVPAQVNADWNSNSGASQILNKPNLATVATTGSYNDLSGKPSLATVATTGSYNDLSDKPTIPTPTIYTAGNGIDITGNAISAKVDGTTITTNSQGQLVATGGGSPSTTIHVVNTDTSTLIAQGSSGLYFTQNFTVNLPSTGIYEFDIATFEDVILNISPTNPGNPWEEKYIADGFSYIVDLGYSKNKDFYQPVIPDYDAYRGPGDAFLNGYGISYFEMYCGNKWCYTVDNVQHHYMGKKVHGKVWINDTTKVPTGLYIAERSAFGATLSQVVSVRCELFFKKIGDLPQWTLANA